MLDAQFPSSINTDKRRKEDIVFIINPALWHSDMYPMGVLYLSAYLQKKGFENIILDSSIGMRVLDEKINEKLVLERIRALKPKIVCFSSTHREFDEVVRMNNFIKNSTEKIFTIVGGPQPTFRPEDYLNNGFDFVGRGEGELTLNEFVKEIFEQTYRWEKILGLSWKDKGKNISNPPRPLMTQEELNEIPMLPYNQISRKYFDINFGLIRGRPFRAALIMTSRGCPFSCSFCGCNLIFGKKIRFFELEHIEREIKYLKETFGIEGLWISDDTFTVNLEHLMNVGNILKKYGIVWACQARVDMANEKLIKTMKELGCVQIDMGVESGSQRILDDIIKKRTNINQVINAFGLAKKYGMKTLANFMIGFPTETYSDLKKTVDLANKIKADYYIFSIAIPLPGTQLYDMVNEPITPQEYSSLDWNGSALIEKINKSELKNLCKERNRLEKKYNRKSLLWVLAFLILHPWKGFKKIYWRILYRNKKSSQENANNKFKIMK